MASGYGTGELREEADREAVVQELFTLMEHSDAPLIQVAQQSDRPWLIVKGSLGATMTSTLKQYVRAIRIFQTWLFTACGSHWTKLIHKVLEYIHHRI